MAISIPLRFFLGRELSKSVGVVEPADLNASGMALVLTGDSPVGIVLARQLAISRAPSTSVPTSTTPTSTTPSTPQTPASSAERPVAGFTYDPPDGQKVQFRDKSSGPIANRNWKFEDGDSTATSGDIDPKYTYGNQGTHKVELTVSNGAGDSSTTVGKITVGTSETPPASSTGTTALVAGFRYATNQLKVTFKDKSSGTASKREWDFGDGSPKSDEVNPEHDYKEAKVYEVKLTLSDNSGGSNTTAQKVQVEAPSTPAPAPAPTAANASAAKGKVI